MEFNKEFLLVEIKEIKSQLHRFLLHPVKEIRHVPDWSWPRLAVLLVLVTAICGVLTGVVNGMPIVAIIFMLISQPIVSAILMAISAAYFYYCFQIFCEKTIPPQKLVTVILFANLPGFLFQILSGYLPPIALIGMGFAAFLLIVGFVENFQLDRKKVYKIVGALYALLFVFWVLQKASSMRYERSWTPESIPAPSVKLGE
jgi:hypothetical protein